MGAPSSRGAKVTNNRCTSVAWGVGHAGDGGWGFNTRPGARLSIVPEPFKGTNVRNCVGKCVELSSRSDVLWQKFGTTRAVGRTLEACGRPATATQSGLLAGNEHRHTKWPVGYKSVRIRPGARETRVAAETRSLRRYDEVRERTKERRASFFAGSKLLGGGASRFRRKQVELRGHSVVHVCSCCCRPTSVERRGRGSCVLSQFFWQKQNRCSTG